LIDALQVLPGIGIKSATRMAFHLLQRNREGAGTLAGAIVDAVRNVGQCRICRNLSETESCSICGNVKRDSAVLCVVESPSDVVAIETTAGYDGKYFVLHGRLSPIDGVGPVELGLDRLREHVVQTEIREVILATNPTVEGEATAHYISEALTGTGVSVTRIAHGVPVGGELEYVDGGTITHALRGRTSVD